MSKSKRGRPKVAPSLPIMWRESTTFLLVTIETLGGIDVFTDAADRERYRAIYMAHMDEMAHEDELGHLKGTAHMGEEPTS